MNHFFRLARLTTLTAAVSLTLGACSLMETERVDYKSAGKAPSLEVPPDLTQLTRNTRYAVPGGAVTALGYQNDKPAVQSVATAAITVGDIRIERSGNQRWLVVARPAEQLWEPVKDFWQESGFLLVQDQANLGIMETDWAENRAKLPQDFIRNTIGKVFDSLYSTGERDKFRTRIERTSAGTSEIYVSHRGMVEVYANSAQKDQTVWTPRAADSELEAEFLRRLMVRLGASPETAKQAVATPIKTSSKVSMANGQPVVVIEESFDRAWRRVGLSLDRTGFTVEDRDRAKGTYFVRYVEPGSDKTDPGFFAKIFGTGPTPVPLKYRINVQSQGEVSTVSVQDGAGTPDASANAQRIVKVIADDLR